MLKIILASIVVSTFGMAGCEGTTIPGGDGTAEKDDGTVNSDPEVDQDKSAGEDDTTGDDATVGDDNSVSETEAIENEIFTLINQERTSRGLTALAKNLNVAAVARAHSQDMIDRDFFSHTNPDGDGPADRLVAAGLRWGAYGENIAKILGGTDLAQEAVTMWMNSTPHRNNILNATLFDETGVGVALDAASGTTFFTQVFFTPL